MPARSAFSAPPPEWPGCNAPIKMWRERGVGYDHLDDAHGPSSSKTPMCLVALLRGWAGWSHFCFFKSATMTPTTGHRPASDCKQLLISDKPMASCALGARVSSCSWLGALRLFHDGYATASRLPSQIGRADDGRPKTAYQPYRRLSLKWRAAHFLDAHFSSKRAM